MPIALVGRDRPRVLESRGVERFEQPLRERGLVLVDERDRRIVDLGGRAFRLGVDGKRERVDDEDHEDGVALKAPQLLGPEPEDVGHAFHDHDSWPLRATAVSTVNTGMNAARARTSPASRRGSSAFVNAPTLACM